MKIFKRLFCKHDYKPIENNYAMLGWYRCSKCRKEKYKGDNTEFTEFDLGEFIIKK